MVRADLGRRGRDGEASVVVLLGCSLPSVPLSSSTAADGCCFARPALPPASVVGSRLVCRRPEERLQDGGFAGSRQEGGGSVVSASDLVQLELGVCPRPMFVLRRQIQLVGVAAEPCPRFYHDFISCRGGHGLGERTAATGCCPLIEPMSSHC